MALIEVKVPDIGDFEEVEVIELLVKPGDTVKAEQSLVTVESDKASMEIPSSHAGVLKELRVKLGDRISEGSVLAVIEVAEAAPASARAEPVEASSFFCTACAQEGRPFDKLRANGSGIGFGYQFTEGTFKWLI